MCDVQNQPPPEAFVSYAHEDQEFLEQLRRHLVALVRQGTLSVWHDADIVPGSDWRDEIEGHLTSSTIHLLLVSSDFIASDFCWSVEMRHALDRAEAGTARVIPIIIRPCMWQDAPFASLQALPPGGAPITTWDNRDEAYAAVAAGIKAMTADLVESGPTSPRESRPT